MNFRSIGLALAFSFLPATPVLAEQINEVAPNEKSSALVSLIRCRAMADNQARLACFDAAVTDLDSAEREGAIVVLDRDQVRETNRRLFGFQVTNPFAAHGNGTERVEIDEIETTLLSAIPSGEGKLIFRLSDESEWRQIDSAPVRFRNRQGEAVSVRRAALGSYFLKVGNSRAVRVRRQ